MKHGLLVPFVTYAVTAAGVALSYSCKLYEGTALELYMYISWTTDDGPFRGSNMPVD